MKLQDVYDAAVIETETEKYPLCDNLEYDELGAHPWDLPHEIPEHVEIKYHIRAAIRVASVWFKGRPIMVIYGGGKGYEENRRYITDKAGFLEMLAYLKTLLPQPKVQVFDVNKEMPELDAFCGYQITL